MGGWVKRGEGLSKRKKNPHRHRQQHGDEQREEGGGRKKRVKGGQMVTEGDWTRGGEHTIQYTDIE